MSMLNLAKKFADEHPEYGVTVKEEVPGVITDIVLTASKPKVDIFLRPRIAYVNTCPNKDKSFITRLKGLSKSAAEEGVELYVETETPEARLAVSRVKTFEEAVKAAEKILKFLKKHNLNWI